MFVLSRTMPTPLAMICNLGYNMLVLDHNAKPISQAALVFLLSGMLAGCIGIPVGNDMLSETVVGERLASGQYPAARIIKARGIRNWWFFMSADGGGVHGISFYAFYYEMAGMRRELHHVPFTPQEDDPLVPFLAVQGSPKWIAARPANIRLTDVDLDVVVFDERRMYKRFLVTGCVKGITSRRRGLDVVNCGIETRDGNSRVIFHTARGNLVFDVAKNRFEGGVDGAAASAEVSEADIRVTCALRTNEQQHLVLAMTLVNATTNAIEMYDSDVPWGGGNVLSLDAIRRDVGLDARLKAKQRACNKSANRMALRPGQVLEGEITLNDWFVGFDQIAVSTPLCVVWSYELHDIGKDSYRVFSGLIHSNGMTHKGAGHGGARGGWNR
jgi:hypothetical protein